MTDLVGHGAFVVLCRKDRNQPASSPSSRGCVAGTVCASECITFLWPVLRARQTVFGCCSQNARQAQAFGHVPCQLYSKPSRLESFLFQSAQPRNRKAAPKPGAPAVTQTGRRRPFPLGGFRVGRARFSVHFFGHGLKHCACLARVPDCCGPATASQASALLRPPKATRPWHN